MIDNLYSNKFDLYSGYQPRRNMKEILFMGCLGLFSFLVPITIVQAISYRNVLTKEDAIRIPKRWIRRVTMSTEKEAKVYLTEVLKLKNFMNTLDLPLREKQSLMWDIERMEKSCVEKFKEKTTQELLDKLKKEISI